jgi:hypothetical protein
MRTVHKYVLPNVRNAIPTFEGAKLLHVDVQNERITLWAEVETNNRECLRIVHVVGTGHPIPSTRTRTAYVGSVLVEDGEFVFHVYEEVEG